MCNRARMSHEPEALWGSASQLFDERPRDNRFDPRELRPKSRNYVIREWDGERAWDVMLWDGLGGGAAWPMTNVRQLGLKQWRALAANPENRCVIPLTEFCEWTPEPVDLGDGKKPLKGEMWFQVTDQLVFPVAGFWQRTKEGKCFTMVTCDPNELVAPIHPKAMITILKPEDVDTWLRGSYEEVVGLQRPYPADKMTVRGPVFPTRGIGVQNSAENY
ncbi:SOS response-associated peptidase family protein [Sphingomonas sp. BAUL-RG-20F-R05-02]|uniref:SOS response-associated peptidase family protein n=1 Tax=Sphingomonas sp. BAUL-RG-20F-R05-02 TaxID=2914830 RepID=UPI001F5A33FD|nr:SOS response-associated peptidase family protein [Sphingomonas sp. BAUL-RG-20F-R05-02]